jgi:tRNA (cmo5U34)-methyltransferase
MTIKDKFNDISAKYESQRRQIIPCIDDFYGVPLRALDFKGDAPRVLDLGSGSGLFTAILLTKFPKAQVTLVDLSDKMLAVAKERFAAHKDFTYVVSDFAHLNVTGPFDIIISGIAIHHIPGPEKQRLYKRCHETLKAGGVFINSDQIKGPTKEMDDLSMNLWRESIESSGLPREEIDAAYERMKFDQPSTVDEQLVWLKEAGFSQVDCLYKWLPLAVFWAKR